MSSTPFDASHQGSMRALIGKVLPGADARHIAEAVAAGYGYGAHAAFLAAIRAVEAGGPAPAADFDPDRVVDRLYDLGEAIGRQDQALRFLLGAMADGPRSGPPPKQEAPDEAHARQCLRAGLVFSQAGRWANAGAALGDAMSAAPDSLKAEIVAALDVAAAHSEAAAANLALALLSADGVPRDVGRAQALLEALVRSDTMEMRAHAHNWLAHIAAGKFGGDSTPEVALLHFEQAAIAGHGEAAFNAALIHDEGKGMPASVGKARDLYRRGVELGHVPSMTNLAIKVMQHDPEEAMDLFEHAAAAGDGKAEALLQAITESDMDMAGGLEDDEEDIGPLPAPVRVVPSGTRRPKALAAALREGIGASTKEAEEMVAFMLGFGSWRELTRAAQKLEADLPDEDCGAEEVGCRRTYQAHVLASCSNMGPVAASIAVEALRPSAKSARPGLEPGTLAHMRAASDAYADEDVDGLDEPDLDEEVTDALGSLMAGAGIDPGDVSPDLAETLRRLLPIQPGVWLGIMQAHLGWTFTDVRAHANRDGTQVAVAVGGGQRRMPVIMAAGIHIPGEPGSEQVNGLKARIAAQHPAGAVLIFNNPTGWLPKHRRGGLVYGGLLWSDGAWSDFVLRPQGGLDDALAQRGRNIAHPDTDTVKALGLTDARGLLRSLAACLAGLEPDEVVIDLLKTPNGWVVPLLMPP